MANLIQNLATARLDTLPPLNVKASEKKSKTWQKAILDSFEAIGVKQLHENAQFVDYYRMVDGKMAYQELSEAIPHLEGVQDLLNGVGVPTFLKHYDIIGIIVNELVGKYIDLQDKFHVIDSGEIAKNEFLRFKDEEIRDAIAKTLESEMKIHLAKMGLSEDGREFQSEEEQQQYIQQLEKAKKEILAPEKMRAKQESFKTAGTIWGEATLEKDTEVYNLRELEKKEFKDYLLTGRCFREYKLLDGYYEPKTWSPINTFTSKEIDVTDVHKMQYVGRIHYYTPSEIIRHYGPHLTTDMQDKLLGGKNGWRSIDADMYAAGSIETAIGSNFGEIQKVPFAGYHDYNFYLGLQEELGIPMGTQTAINPDGTTRVTDRFLPRMQNEPLGRYTALSSMLRSDIINPRKDLCQVTEVYFIAYDYVGFLTYEDEYGKMVTEMVTEDILPEFLKERNIKQSYKSKFVDRIEGFEMNTLQWFYTENTYEGVKVQSQYLQEPLYIYCKKMDNQIPGASQFQRHLPVAGRTGKSIAARILPFQAKYNLCMNQVWNLLEKEIGMFFLFDITLIPSEYDNLGDPEDALSRLMDIAKNTGIMPVATSGDAQKNKNTFNQFAVHDISFTKQISSRIEYAEFCQRKAYEIIGVTPQIQAQPSKYETATGVKVGQETAFARLSEIYEDFSYFKKASLNLHLSVAKYAQSNNMDDSLYYTKSDASIKFLQISDPLRPLRDLGVIASVNNKKRAEFEQFKSMLLQNNTLGSDVVELGKLFLSDSVQEAMQIMMSERARRDEQEQNKFAQDQQLMAQKGEQDKALADAAWEREKYKIDTKAKVDIEVAGITATGRGVDKESSQSDLDRIKTMSEESRKQFEAESKVSLNADRFKLDETKHMSKMELEAKKLELKAKELEIKKKQIDSANYVATVNPG